ncbi:hypothetical protein MN202_16740 [Rheinheimera muenzenbergensis]|uniref:MSHA biogenesis protein MshK n=1 Tax=Rheinheimera muenzenbergensis TaxID=1193628 RepID=A0ABU8CBM3_9GAMM
MKILFVCSFFMLSSQLVMADPTRPAPGWQADALQTGAVPITETLKLQLIKDSPQGKTALINGQLLRKGQSIKHYTVEDITAQQVTLEANGERHVLSLLNTAIKQYE